MNINEVGSWKKIRVLGSGGFGHVTLWHNSKTDQKIAIKRLREQPLEDDVAKVKQIERWCKEVEIMKKLNHSNIVSTLEIPVEFKMISSLPLLAMEYCSLGDLRRVLNKPENCNGLREPEILDILKDVSNGLAYLHSCKIIHRDLKPDNIVLMKNQSKIIYKLIDLGYAKALDENSLSQSFVGTIQYIAPELFLGKAYTSSVDFWSFGLLTHEIITGFRPFLPGFNPSDWMRQIRNKDKRIICVSENLNGDIVFSSTISRKNHVSRHLLKHLEKWLQLALDWDGQTRGRDPHNNQQIIFQELRNLISKKIIKVFSIPTYETLDYEITTDTDISDLKNWIKNEIDLEIDDQILLFPSGKALNMKGNLWAAVENEKVENDDDILIYLYNGGEIYIKSKVRDAPQYVKELMDNENKILKYRHLKRCCADSVYYLQEEAIRYRRLMRGIRVRINSTKQKTLAIESLHEDVSEEWNQIESYSQFLFLSHKTDLENYIQFRKIGKLKASPQIPKWIQNITEVERKINDLKNLFNKNEHRQLVLLAKQRYHYLDSHPGHENTQKTILDEISNEGYKLWENIINFSKEKKESSTSNNAAILLIRRAVEETNKLLNNQMLQTLFSKISEADENLSKFLTRLTTVLKSTKILKRVIENTQKERQTNVWNMLLNNQDKETEKIENETENLESSINCMESMAPKSLHRNDNSFSKTTKLENESNRISWELIDYNVNNQLDANTIINDNNYLRYKFQEVQDNFNHTVKKIRALNFDMNSNLEEV